MLNFKIIQPSSKGSKRNYMDIVKRRNNNLSIKKDLQDNVLDKSDKSDNYDRKLFFVSKSLNNEIKTVYQHCHLNNISDNTFSTNRESNKHEYGSKKSSHRRKEILDLNVNHSSLFSSPSYRIQNNTHINKKFLQKRNQTILLHKDEENMNLRNKVHNLEEKNKILNTLYSGIIQKKVNIIRMKLALQKSIHFIKIFTYWIVKKEKMN